MRLLSLRALCLLAGPAIAANLLHCTKGIAGENYAFLVAVQDYDLKDFKPLQYTRNDILEFAKLLGTAGFKPENIVVLTDKSDKPRYLAEAEKIRKELDLLLDGLDDGDTLIVAFSGHGIQFEGEEKNYYCPLDTDLEDPKRGKLIALSEIYDKLKQCTAEKKLLLVDACRNDPLSNIKKSRDTVKLKSVTRPQSEPVPKGVVALFSCAAGQQSYEWPELKHGVFFHHVLEGWKGAADDGDRQITLDEVVTYSRQKTQAFARLTLKAAQTPQLKSDFSGTWVLSNVGAGTGKIPEGFVSIFNGKDFEGWGGAVENFEVKESSIVCKRGKGGTIFTNEDFGDFVASLEFKLPPGGNSGLAIRYPGSGDPSYVGMCELKVLDTDHTKYARIDPRQAHGSAYGMVPARRGHLRPTGEWNYQKVTVKGSTIKVELNGTTILDTDLSKVTEYMANLPHPGKDRTTGHFGISGHSDPVEFRSIAIKKL